MRTKPSIYPKCNPQLTKLFEQAGHPAKVICVALDYAKRQHTALICNGTGEVLKSAFPADNNPAGARTLLKEVRECAKARNVASSHIFFAGEDCPSFAENFLQALRQKNYLLIRLNAWEAKKHRDNNQASTDKLDLLGIARCALNRKGTTMDRWPEPYLNLRLIMRSRDKLVGQSTAISNRIHTYVDRLFPGFLTEGPIGAFSQASLDLMAERFSPSEISRRQQPALADWLQARGVENADRVAAELRKKAKATFQPAPEETALLQHSLGQLVRLYRESQASIESLTAEAAFWLARTPGALLTSIDGIGVVLAAALISELGPPAQWRAVRRLCSYAGVVPQTKQTGGPQKEPQTQHPHARCNKRFKGALLSVVEHVCRYASGDLRATIQALQAGGQHTRFAMAKRLIRLSKHLALKGTVYRPKALMASDTPREQLAAYYAKLWEKLRKKWSGKADFRDIFADDRPLGQWRQMACELYGLKLRLPAASPSK